MFIEVVFLVYIKPSKYCLAKWHRFSCADKD